MIFTFHWIYYVCVVNVNFKGWTLSTHAFVSGHEQKSHYYWLRKLTPYATSVCWSADEVKLQPPIWKAYEQRCWFIRPFCIISIPAFRLHWPPGSSI